MRPVFSVTGKPEDEVVAFETLSEFDEFDTAYCWAFPQTAIANVATRLDCVIACSQKLMGFYRTLSK